MSLFPVFRRRASTSTGTPESNGSRGTSPAADTLSHDVEPSRIVQNARREFAGVFGDLVRGKRNWQLIAYALAAILAVATAGAARLSFSARIVPYIVQVDQLGRIGLTAPAERMRAPDDRLVASQLAAFIRSVRTILPAAAAGAQAEMLKRGYAFAMPEAAGYLNSYFSEPDHDPRVLSQRLIREVDVGSVLRVPDADKSTAHREGSAQTWRLQWTETDRPTQAGDSTHVTAWEGYLTLRVVPPRTAETVQENPLGLNITSIAWTRVGRRVVPDSAAEGRDVP